MTGSYKVMLNLVCDACGRRVSYEWSYPIPKTRVISLAREKGWTIGQYTICQSCKASGITWRDLKKVRRKVGGMQ